ncbi:hypothetical protein [Aeromicrobium sp. Leaf350]|uniref:hypothetical protein n=1 Tax=Aeromicrobium sp. Leaf350 TaxID=2876565 RepID=UPI001E421098|nr:hypothetical protein [Aeromicrobium sp. Leaf350]
MRAVRHPLLALLPVLVLVSALTACSEDAADDDEKPFAYASELQAPDPEEYSEDGGDVHPNRDNAFVELELDSGAELVVWIDPDDIRQVLVQHSDPRDPEAWTEPRPIFVAGDGCLEVGAGTDGTTVAVALGCYVDDAFEQQAPDQGAALVTSDLRTWELDDELGEFACDEPEVEDGEVVFQNDIYDDRSVTWTPDDGFDDQDS